MDDQKTPPPVAQQQRSLLAYLRRFIQRSPHPARRPAASYTRLPLPTRSRLEASLDDSAFNPAKPPASGTILYLAYGSNLCFETFQGRRGIRPLAAANVVVPELKLTFDLPGMPYTEPCFANSARRTASDVPNPDLDDTASAAASEWTLVHDVVDSTLLESTHLTASETSHSVPLIGVVYEVTAQDYAHIIATEGPTYTDIVVTCSILPTEPASDGEAASDFPAGKTFKAHTLLAPPSAVRNSPTGKPAQPSLRYLTLCRNGAAEHDLPPEWQAYLGNLQHYEMTTLRQRLGQAVLIAVFAPVFILVFGLRARFARSGKKMPKWLTGLMPLLFKSIWRSYDWVLRPLFGEGERTEESKNAQVRSRI